MGTGVNVLVRVEEEMCQEKRTLSQQIDEDGVGSKIAIAFFGFVLIAAILMTAYDWQMGDDAKNKSIMTLTVHISN